jgi:23S rRNA pseudouridine2605 synthase
VAVPAGLGGLFSWPGSASHASAPPRAPASTEAPAGRWQRRASGGPAAEAVGAWAREAARCRWAASAESPARPPRGAAARGPRGPGLGPAPAPALAPVVAPAPRPSRGASAGADDGTGRGRRGGGLAPAGHTLRGGPTPRPQRPRDRGPAAAPPGAAAWRRTLRPWSARGAVGRRCRRLPAGAPP